MSKISLKHSGGNVVSLNVPTSAPTSADVAFKLPNADGSSGQFIKTDGSGNLSFGAVTSPAILQVIQTFKTDAASQSGNSSTVFYDISGMSATITPSSSSNKVLVMWTAQVSSSGASGRGNLLRLLRGSSVVGASTAGSNEQVQVYDRTVQNNLATKNMMFLDTPNTTSATTYKLQWSVEGSGGNPTTYYLNRNSGGGYGTTSHITLMEVAG
jgi:hypothetical protein